MISLLPSLRASLFHRYYILKGDTDVQLGYFIYSRLTSSPSEIVYREFDNTLVVFSSVDNEIVLIDPINRRVYNRIKDAGNPVSPGIYFPDIDGVVFRGDGGIDSDGLYILTKNDSIISLASIGDGTIGEIAYGFYSPVDKLVYLFDNDRSLFHRINVERELETNVLSLFEPSNDIKGLDYSFSNNTIYLVDSENNKVQYFINPSNPSKGSFSLPFNPQDLAWSPWDSSLYVTGLFSTTIYRYNQQGQTFTETANSSNTFFDGTITGLDFDSIRQRVYTKVTSGLLSKDQLIYVQPFSNGNISRIGSLFIPLQDQTVKPVPKKLKIYTTDSEADTIRSYPIHQTIVDQRVIGTKGSIISSLYFFGNEGLIVLDGLTATVFNRILGVRTVGFSLLDNYSSYVSAGDNILQAQWLDNEGEQILLFSFDNSVVIAVNDAFSVLTQVPIEDVVLTVGGTDVLINPSVEGSYEIVEFDYNRSFQHLFIAVANGKTENSSYHSGIVLVYDISAGIANAQPIAFAEMPQSINRLRSIAVNTSANYLLAIGDSSNNSIFRAYDAVPKGSELSLFASKTASLGTTNLSIFKGRVVFASSSNSVVYNLGKALAANFSQISLTGQPSQITQTEKHGFIFVLDPPNNRLFVLNSLYNPYAVLYFSGKPKTFTYFQDSLYVVYEQTLQSLPSLASIVLAGQETNLLTFSSPIGVSIDVGDVITVSKDQTIYYLVSLSQVTSSSTTIYVETFIPSTDLDPSSTTIELTGDVIARINQEPLQKQVKGSVTSIKTEFTIGTSFDTYYSLEYSPYLLTNSTSNTNLQSIKGEFNILGDPFTNRLDSPSFQNKTYLYAVSLEGTFYRIHILNRVVQTVTLEGGPNTSNLKDFTVSDNNIYALFNNDNTLYWYSILEEASSSISYQLEDTLALNSTPSSVSYSVLDNLIQVYTNDLDLIRVKP